MSLTERLVRSRLQWAGHVDDDELELRPFGAFLWRGEGSAISCPSSAARGSSSVSGRGVSIRILLGWYGGPSRWPSANTARRTRRSAGIRRMWPSQWCPRVRTGHVERMADDRLPKRAAELREQGRRRRGRPMLRWEDCVKRDVKKTGEEEDWKKKIEDRGWWNRLDDRWGVEEVAGSTSPLTKGKRGRDMTRTVLVLGWCWANPLTSPSVASLHSRPPSPLRQPIADEPASHMTWLNQSPTWYGVFLLLVRHILIVPSTQLSFFHCSLLWAFSLHPSSFLKSLFTQFCHPCFFFSYIFGNLSYFILTMCPAHFTRLWTILPA